MARAARAVTRREQRRRRACGGLDAGPGRVPVAPDLVPPGQDVPGRVRLGGQAHHGRGAERGPAEFVGPAPDDLDRSPGYGPGEQGGIQGGVVGAVVPVAARARHVGHRDVVRGEAEGAGEFGPELVDALGVRPHPQPRASWSPSRWLSPLTVACRCRCSLARAVAVDGPMEACARYGRWYVASADAATRPGRGCRRPAPWSRPARWSRRPPRPGRPAGPRRQAASGGAPRRRRPGAGPRPAARPPRARPPRRGSCRPAPPRARRAARARPSVSRPVSVAPRAGGRTTRP